MENSKLRRQLLDWRLTLGVVVLASIAFRLAVWQDFLRTPLDMYTKISTLDMKFLMSQAESLLRLEGMLTMHRLLCVLSAPFTGGALTTHGVVVAQMLFGVLTGVLTCLAALRISGSRLAGLVAGVFSGCYAPALMYECFVMKESVTLLFSALTLWSFVAARRKIWQLAGHGLAAAALPLARPAGLLWALGSTGLLSLRNWRRGPAFAIAPAAAMILGLLGALAFNLAFAKTARFFDTNVGYNIQVGAIPDAKSYNVDGSGVEGLSKASLALRLASNAPAKALSLLSAYQAPDNINYYFMKEPLPSLSFAIGPLLLVPLGVAGLFLGLWLAFRRRKLRYAAPFAHFILMAIPICAFIVTGRYLLFLVPSLAVAAGCFVHFLAASVRTAISEKAFAAPGALAAIWLFCLWLGLPTQAGLRADDFIAYGLAMNMKHGLCQQEGECYAKALAANPESAGAAVNLSKWLLDVRRPGEAAELLAPFRQSHPGHFGILVNYSLSLIILGRQADAERELLAYGEPGDGVAKAKWRTLLKMSGAASEGREAK